MTRIGDDVAATFHHGRNSDIDTAAEPLTTTPRRVSRGVQLKAAATNSAVIYVGNQDVTIAAQDATDGFPLEPGDALFLPIDSPHKIFLVAAAPNQSVSWLAV